MERYGFSVSYSEDLARRSVRRYFLTVIRRELSWGFWAAVAVAGGEFIPTHGVDSAALDFVERSIRNAAGVS